MPEQDSPDLVWIELHVEAFGGEADDYVSVPAATWDAMTPDEQEKWIDDALDIHMGNHVAAVGQLIDEADVPESERDR